MKGCRNEGRAHFRGWECLQLGCQDIFSDAGRRWGTSRPNQMSLSGSLVYFSAVYAARGFTCNYRLHFLTSTLLLNLPLDHLIFSD